jgi:hypothetical protein
MGFETFMQPLGNEVQTVLGVGTVRKGSLSVSNGSHGQDYGAAYFHALQEAF